MFKNTTVNAFSFCSVIPFLCICYLGSKLVAIKDADKLVDDGKYAEAIEAYEKIGDRFESEKLQQAKYGLAIEYFEDENYYLAKELFTSLGNYEDSELYLAKIDNTDSAASTVIYNEACTAYNDGDYTKALELFTTITDYKDSTDYVEKCKGCLKD